ncbi:MAG: hypothetical protein H0T66_19110 [Geodermatophilaceae bacterium]|nr:hypothetical protein [Geodermatophilaceae bacterium]MDQ3456856.1 hypothetical protein [Actinomycetota bacterium]
MSPVRRAPSRLTGTEARLRTAYLGQVTDLLWPAHAGSGADELIVVPNLRKPRLLLPAAAPRAAATAIRRYSEPKSRLSKLRLDLLALSVRSGVAQAVMRDRIRVPSRRADRSDTIETYLSSSLGIDVTVSLHIGPARANRKPVLTVLSPHGDLIGYAKIGINDLTKRLVAAEGASLAALSEAAWSQTLAPAVLHAGQWRGLEVLVQSPLPVHRPRVALQDGRLARSMLEVATVRGGTAEVLTDSPYWQGLMARLAGLQPSVDTGCLREAVATVAHRQPARTPMPLLMGTWHGDWTPWNMAVLADRILLWDWERFGGPVPIGFDALHYRLQRAVVRTGVEPRAAVADTVAAAPQVLAPFGVRATDARLVALLYLIDLAARYLQDGQAEAGARLGVLGQWLLPELVAQLADMRCNPLQ